MVALVIQMEAFVGCVYAPLYGKVPLIICQQRISIKETAVVLPCKIGKAAVEISDTLVVQQIKLRGRSNSLQTID